jgi:hypothetical protein
VFIRVNLWQTSYENHRTRSQIYPRPLPPAGGRLRGQPLHRLPVRLHLLLRHLHQPFRQRAARRLGQLRLRQNQRGRAGPQTARKVAACQKRGRDPIQLGHRPLPGHRAQIPADARHAAGPGGCPLSRQGDDTDQVAFGAAGRGSARAPERRGRPDHHPHHFWGSRPPTTSSAACSR